MEEYFRVFRDNADAIRRVTVWGLSDRDTWRNDWPIPGRTDYAVLFDRELNEKPVVLTDTLYASEDALAGTEIGLLDADDPDGPTTYTYTLVRASKEFDVDPSGSVSVKIDNILDYETKNHQYTIYVNVQDADGLASDTKPVVIIVSDVNEPPTLRDTTIYIREDASVDTIFGKVVGTDPDIYTEEFNQLSYRMISVKDIGK